MNCDIKTERKIIVMEEPLLEQQKVSFDFSPKMIIGGVIFLGLVVGVFYIAIVVF